VEASKFPHAWEQRPQSRASHESGEFTRQARRDEPFASCFSQTILSMHEW